MQWIVSKGQGEFEPAMWAHQDLAKRQNGVSTEAVWPNLTVFDIANMIELTITGAGQDSASVEMACQPAIAHQIPVVVCRPEQVTVAAGLLSGAGPKVATILDVDHERGERFSSRWLRAKARPLVANGARELAIAATADRLQRAGGASFAENLRCLVEAMVSEGVRIRVIIDGRRMTPARVLETAAMSLEAGAHLIECGAVPCGRIRLAMLHHLRARLGAGATLKWAPVVRNLDMLLIALAEGANRFNGDPAELLRQAQARTRDSGIQIPRPGHDYCR